MRRTVDDYERCISCSSYCPTLIMQTSLNSPTVGLQSSCVYYRSESYSVTFSLEKLPIKLAKTAMVFYLLSNRGKALD